MRKLWAAAALTAVMTCAAAGSAFAQGWVQTDIGWRYASDENNAVWLNDGWHWLDGNKDGVSECYYFNADGYMLASAETPDHYRVNADGAWVNDAGAVQTKTAGPGSLGSVGASQTGQNLGGGTQQSQPAQTQGNPAPGTGTGTAVSGPFGVVTPEPEPEAAAPEVAEEQPAATGRVIDPNLPMVALTYDDGPQTGAGNRILDTLAAYGAKATFFLVGDRCASRAAEVQRMVAEGHEVGNHTYGHAYLQKLGAAEIRSQISRGSDAIAAAGGGTPALVRLPGGNKNSTVLANVNYPMIQWSIDTRDWEHRNAQKTINEVLSKVRDGDIVLMHELYDATATATETIVPELIARGYQLVTVSEMAAAKGVPLEAGKLYYNFR